MKNLYNCILKSSKKLINNTKFQQSIVKPVILGIVLLFLNNNLQAQEAPIGIYTGHSYSVEAVAYSPDGHTIVSGGGYFFDQSNELNIWQPKTGRFIHSLNGHTDVVTSIAFSPDGKYIISGSQDNTVRIWDLKNGTQIEILNHHTKKVTAVDYSPQGKYIASASADKTARIYDLKTNETKTLQGHFGVVNAVTFSKDGRYCITGSSDGFIKIWDARTGLNVKTLRGHATDVFSVDVSPDGLTIVSGSKDKSIKLWELQSGTLLKTLKGHTNWVTSVKFNPDGKYIVSGSWDNTVRLWDVNKGELKKTFQKHKDKVTSVCFSPDGRYVISASGDKTVNLWNVGEFATYEVKIKAYVTEEINKWQQKGQYEKISTYEKRVNTDLRSKKIEALTQKAINRFAIQELNLVRPKASFKYDSESEVFKINNPSFPPIYVPVPIDEAQEFDINFKNLEFNNTQFNLHAHKFIITETDIYNPKSAKYYRYDINKAITFNSVDITTDFKPVEFDIPGIEPTANVKEKKQNIHIGRPEVDTKIPKTDAIKPNTYALIIGNEDYSSYQTGLSTEVNVDYALNDAEIFKEYLIKTLGVPKRQIKILKNGTSGQMRQGLSWINNLAEIETGNAELIFYYSGHGLPHESTKEAYLIPVDVAGTNLEYAIKLKDVYKTMLEHPVKKATVFLDACFSGGGRNQGLVAMKSVKIKPKQNMLNGNIVVFASSSGEESSAVYRDKQHGYFTYFLLKKMQETNGNITYNNLYDYIKINVQKEAGLNSKKQTPAVNVSPNVEEIWGTWKLR